MAVRAARLFVHFAPNVARMAGSKTAPSRLRPHGGFAAWSENTHRLKNKMIPKKNSKNPKKKAPRHFVLALE